MNAKLAKALKRIAIYSAETTDIKMVRHRDGSIRHDKSTVEYMYKKLKERFRNISPSTKYYTRVVGPVMGKINNNEHTT